MNRRVFLASLLLAPLVAVSLPARLAYEAPTMTRLPFKLPKATGPFIPKAEPVVTRDWFGVAV